MTRVPVDAAVHTVLLNLNASVELVDNAGRVVARVYPVLDPALYENLEGSISREELDRRKKDMDNPNNRTLSDVLAEFNVP